MEDKCSLGLYTKTKDKRDLLANISHEYDKKYNIPFLKEDEEKKCLIFKISNLKTDFITRTKIQTGDHYYPIGAHHKKEHIIGSDSEWNRIPVSGSNKKENKYNNLKKRIKNSDISKFNDEEQLIIQKINNWINYVKSREARMYHKISEEFIERLNKRDEIMMKEQEESFNYLKQLIPLN